MDEALSFGWIDGVRRGRDETSYTIRFTPRTASSTWSTVNVARVEELSREGRMRPAGLRAFERRDERNTGIYSYERRAAAKLPDEFEREFRADDARVELLRGPAAVVPADLRLLGGQRQARGDAAPAAHDPDRGLARRSARSVRSRAARAREPR